MKPSTPGQVFPIYSRIGKTCEQRFTNIKEYRNEILLGKTPKKKKFRLSFENKNQQLSPEQLQELIAETETAQQKNRKEKTTKFSANFTSQGREDYYRSIVSFSQNSKDRVPPCGYYSLNYNLVHQRVKSPDLSEKPKNQSKIPRSNTQVDLRLVNFPSQKLKLPMDFNKQLERPGVPLGNVHESRFDSKKDYPSIYSNNRRVTTPNFSKGFGHKFEFPEVMNSAMYSPDYDKVFKNTTKPILEFSKYTTRQPIEHSNVNDLVYDRINYSVKEKRHSVIDMNRGLSRPSTTELPTFMSRNHSRAALNTISDKTLALNSYQTADLGKVTSEFQSPRTASKRSYTSSFVPRSSLN